MNKNIKWRRIINNLSKYIQPKYHYNQSFLKNRMNTNTTVNFNQQQKHMTNI